MILEFIAECFVEGVGELLIPAGNGRVLRNCLRKEVRQLWNGYLRNYPVPFEHPGAVAEDYLVDFYCEKANMVIEIVTDEQEKHQEAKRYRKKKQAFQDNRIGVLRIPIQRLRTDMNGVCDTIDRTVKHVLSLTQR